MAGGRPKGSLNGSHEQLRCHLVKFFERNAPDLDSIFQKMKAEDPDKAFRAIMSTAEYVMPRLQKQTIEGGNTPLQIEHKLHTDDAELLKRFYATRGKEL